MIVPLNTMSPYPKIRLIHQVFGFWNIYHKSQENNNKINSKFKINTTLLVNTFPYILLIKSSNFTVIASLTAPDRSSKYTNASGTGYYLNT